MNMPKILSNTVEMTQEVIVAFLSKNATDPAIVTELMRSVHSTFVDLENRETKRAEMVSSPRQKPIAPNEESYGPEFVVCLECRKKFKSLRFHLRRHGLSVEAYRAKWALPFDHPMVATNLSATRSKNARATNFGLARQRSRLAAK